MPAGSRGLRLLEGRRLIQEMRYWEKEAQEWQQKNCDYLKKDFFIN